MDKKEYIKKFKRCILEYTSPAGAFDVSEEGEDDMMQGGDPSMGGADPSMGGDPGMGGDMGGDPNAMGGDPNAMGGDPNAAGGEATPPEGFQPQGVEQGAPMDGMGGDPNAQGGMDPTMGGDPNAMGDPSMGGDPNAMGGDDEVIDVDDLTDSQEETEKKVDALSGKFERLMSSLDNLEKRISDIDTHTNEYLGKLESEFEKRNPTPLQRMSMRSTKSAPYGMTPNEYMNNYAPENYSDADDNNGADDPQYKITKGDIDRFTDYNSIAKEFDGKLGLHDILGY
jgi:hypothetical protein